MRSFENADLQIIAFLLHINDNVSIQVIDFRYGTKLI